jgi:protein involved in polysaccharide export with SLBB domain
MNMKNCIGLLRRVPLAAAAVLLLGEFFCIYAQQRPNPTEAPARLQSGRQNDVSELAKENYDRVAASAEQIQAILLKDPGLLVELKRLIAKEATDNGQVVDDAALNDTAVFDRLGRDVVFRSAATKLLQRYGYLLPIVNPQSEAGKQQELLLKERTRRLAQIEEQENAQALLPQPKNAEEPTTNVKRRPNCDPRDQQCFDTPANQAPNQSLPPGTAPETGPYSPALPELLQNTQNPQILRTSTGQGAGQATVESDGDVTSGSSSLASRLRALQETGLAQDGFGMELSMLTGAGGLRGNAGDMDIGGLLGRGNGISDSSTRLSEGSTPRIPASRSTNRGGISDRDLTPVTLVHRDNPYSDVPSLFDMYVQASTKEKEPERFGLKVFRSEALASNAVPMDLPVGPEYVVGPGDGLAIDMWGGVSQRMVRTVDREGRLTLPEVGPLLVSGHSLGEVQRTVQELLRTQYRDVSADVSLSRLRTVRVYVVGEVADPGAYDISSLSTPLNALFAAGGITSHGSLRDLKHFRGKQLVEQVDAYSLLLRGVEGDLAHLENGDTLLVPPVGAQVTMDGMVRRPAIYELRAETNLSEVIELAGGILPAAALKHIEVQRLDAHEKRTMLSLDITQETDSASIAKQLSVFKIQDGDEIHIFPIAPYNENAIYLQGHVQRPGRYSYHDGMKVTDLISSYNDLLPEPAAHYAEIIRLQAPDYRPKVESFDLSAALKNPASAPPLSSHDTVRIFSRYDFESAPWVWVGGDVRNPGRYNTSGQVHLRDALYLAGGLSPDASLAAAQLFRTQSDGTMKIFSVNLREALAGSPTDDLLLEPRDRLLIQKNPAQVDPATVEIRGEVPRPGRYPLATNMHIADLLAVAGGLKRSADSHTADLTRYSASGPVGGQGGSTTVDLSAVDDGNAAENVSLHAGDILTVRERTGWADVGAAVAVRGEVQHPGTYGIQPGEQLSSVLQRSGGFTPLAYPYGALLMRRDVRDVEIKSQLELVQRLKAEEVNLKAMPENDEDQKNAKMTAIGATQTAITQLQANEPIGRVVIHIKPQIQEWQNTAADAALRDGDVLVIPKKTDYVMVSGQVYNPTAVGYQSGKSARWYLSQAGGITQIADKKAVFVVRADGSVVASKNNNNGWFSGDPLSTTLRPGDSIVVPEKAPKIGNRNWTTAIQTAQVAASIALAVAYIHP